MTIPATVRRPGVYTQFLVDRGSSAALPVRLAVLAIKSASGTATPGVAEQVLDSAHADVLAGRGSQGALMLRACFMQGQRSGSATPEIWFMPIAAPTSGAAAATQTWTVTTTTVLAGEVVFAIAGRPLVASVAAGDSATAIAASMKAAVDAEMKNLPVTASVAAGVMTTTAVHAGVHGNDIAYRVISAPSGVSVVAAAGTVGAGVVDITASLDAMLDRDYDAIVLGNHTATDISDAIAHTDSAWGYEQARYRHVILGERGTLATSNALAIGANNKTIVVVGCEGCPNLPGEMAATFATATWSKVNSAGVMPNANLNGERLYLYPPVAADAYSPPETESALAAGSTPLRPTTDGQAVEVVRAVTTKTTDSAGARDESEYDLARSRVQAHLARLTSSAMRTKMPQDVRDDDLLAKARDIVLDVHRSLASTVPPVLINVEQLKGELRTSYVQPSGRIKVDAPHSCADPHHQTVIVSRQVQII